MTARKNCRGTTCGNSIRIPTTGRLTVGELESKGSFRDREIELRRKDGKLIYCLASGFAVRDTFGRIARLQGTLVDITERREMEKKLHQEQEFVRRLVANFPDLIAVFDREGRFTYVSQSVKDVLGGAARTIPGDTLASRASREDQRKLAEMFQNVMSGNQSERTSRSPRPAHRWLLEDSAGKRRPSFR